MLLLTRRENESIVLSSRKSGLRIAEATVTFIQPGQAKIELTAAGGVLIDSYETQQFHQQWVKCHGVIVLSDTSSGDVIATIHNRGISGNQVKIGVNAGSDVIIDRYEIHQRKLEEANQHECLLSA